MKMVLVENGYELLTQAVERVEESVSNGILHPDLARESLLKARTAVFEMQQTIKETVIIESTRNHDRGTNWIRGKDGKPTPSRFFRS